MPNRFKDRVRDRVMSCHGFTFLDYSLTYGDSSLLAVKFELANAHIQSREAFNTLSTLLEIVRRYG
jgi:hypothetical protein